jgi:hypothetical protein
MLEGCLDFSALHLAFNRRCMCQWLLQWLLQSQAVVGYLGVRHFRSRSVTSFPHGHTTHALP